MIVSLSGDTPYRTMFTDGKREGFCDTTPDKGGSGSGFRPHDLLEAAVACCINMNLKMFADRNKIPLIESIDLLFQVGKAVDDFVESRIFTHEHFVHRGIIPF